MPLTAGGRFAEPLKEGIVYCLILFKSVSMFVFEKCTQRTNWFSANVVLTAVIAITISFNTKAQVNLHSPVNDLVTLTQGNENKGLQKLLEVELKILNSMPRMADYKNINDRVKELPIDDIRLLDSIDYFVTKKDTLMVWIYCQDYAYQSKNCYKLGLIDQNSDSLSIHGWVYDMKMKPVIDDYETFVNRQFDYKLHLKEVDGTNKVKRLIISKTSN